MFSAFPERPGALRKFLLGLQQGWNISLFHYRNHGAGKPIFADLSLHAMISVCDQDLGKVLAGIQVPESDTSAFSEFLEKLDYSYVEETENEIYKRFLKK